MKRRSRMRKSNSLPCSISRRRWLLLLLLLAPLCLLIIHIAHLGRSGQPTQRTGKNGILRNIASAYLEPELLNGGTFDGDWKVVAYAVTLTKDDDHMDGATVLAVSIDSVCGDSRFLCDLVAFLHDDVGPASEAMLRRLGFKVMRPGLPLDVNEIQDEKTRNHVVEGGCCGAAELMKLFAYTLTEYHRVVHLDTDTLLLQSLDPILDENESLLYTTDINMASKISPVLPVQGGFLVVRPDVVVFQHIIEVLKTTALLPRGWDNSGIGTFWGGITVQGLLPYYYEHRASPENKYRAVDRCVFNCMSDTPECKAMDIAAVRSIHYTNCQKPWTCLYPNPRNKLCNDFYFRWFQVREQAEIALGLPHIKACPSGRRNDYDPMLSMEKMEEMERAQTRQAA